MILKLGALNLSLLLMKKYNQIYGFLAQNWCQTLQFTKNICLYSGK